jgi:hypothetical protein
MYDVGDYEVTLLGFVIFVEGRSGLRSTFRRLLFSLSLEFISVHSSYLQQIYLEEFKLHSFDCLNQFYDIPKTCYYSVFLIKI